MSDHTPGPWGIAATDQSNIAYGTWKFPIHGPNGQYLADAYFVMGQQPGIRDKEAQANARLIAAAPDLFDALASLEEAGLLDSLLDLDEACLDDNEEAIARPIVERARAALAKTRG